MPKKRALLCAIDDYGDPRNNLPSCRADARAFKQLLKEYYGFGEGDIRELYDSAATVTGLRSELSWLFEAPDPDDRFVFYYSGHGYTRLEDGVLEEMLVLRGVDGGIDFFKDDELSSRTQDLPPGCLTVISDSCYSGGMEKVVFSPDAGSFEAVRAKVYMPGLEMQGEKALAISQGQVKKFKPFLAEPTADIGELRKSFSLDPLFKARLGVDKAGTDETGQVQTTGLLMSACREDETAAASSAGTDGLSRFTYALVSVIENPEVEGPEVGYGSSSAEIHGAVTTKILSEGGRQTPLLKEPEEPEGLGSRSFITLEAVAGPATPVPVGDQSWMDQLLQQLQGMLSKEPSVQTPTKGVEMDTTADKGIWDVIERIPDLVNIGMDVYRTVTKEGLLPADKAVELPAGATEQEQEKWLELIPQVLNIGAQVYRTLTKEGMLSADKAVELPEDATLQEPEKWLNLVPQIVSIGLDVYNSLKNKGFVAPEKAAILPENTTEQEAQKWLSLIPTAIGIGLQVYNSLKSKGLILDTEEPAKAVGGVSSGGNGASRESTDTLSEAVTEALSKAGYQLNT